MFGQSQSMTNEHMEEILKSEVEELQGQAGAWQFVYGQHIIFILTDEANNRMRIFSPIKEDTALEDGQMKKMLEANFHSALDAKYSLYNGFVVSVYTHPLGELQKEQFIDALRQVANLAANFGTSYNSTELIFGSSSEDPVDEKEKEDKKINQKPKNG